MKNFMPGKWWVAPPMFDGDVICALPQVKGRLFEVIAMGITNKADAKLIAAAPEMYEALKALLDEIPIIAGDSRHDNLAEAIHNAYQLIQYLDSVEEQA